MSLFERMSTASAVRILLFPAESLMRSHDAKGIKISRGSIMHPDAEVLLSWKKIEKRIGELIATDQLSQSSEKSTILRIVPKRKPVEGGQLFQRSFAPSFMTTTTM
jgi:hypothetical protein